MITAVDTNILIDILEPDPTYGSASKEALKRCLLEGVVVACEVVWAEVSVVYAEAQDVLVEVLKQMGIQFSAMSLEASLMAARCSQARWWEEANRCRFSDRWSRIGAM